MKTLLLLITVIFVFTSCKKCDPTNSFGGEIIEEAVIQILGVKLVGPILVTNNQSLTTVNGSLVSARVRFPNELDFQPVDFTKYSIVGIPTTASCSSGYNRKVDFDDFNNIVRYSIEIKECPTCDGVSTIENWVLIPKVSPNFSVLSEVSFN